MDKEYRCKYCGAKAGKYQSLCHKCYEKRRLVREFLKVAAELKSRLR
jgi:predicted ATP-dependent serine protease